MQQLEQVGLALGIIPIIANAIYDFRFSKLLNKVDIIIVLLCLPFYTSCLGPGVVYSVGLGLLYLIFYKFHILYPGDIKFALAIGFYLAPTDLGTVLISQLITFGLLSIYSAIATIFQLKREFPFGPMMAIGVITSLATGIATGAVFIN
jgi:prepilin signal peptidase PulO-like enzyme (type II secretory pathway)